MSELSENMKKNLEDVFKEEKREYHGISISDAPSLLGEGIIDDKFKNEAKEVVDSASHGLVVTSIRVKHGETPEDGRLDINSAVNGDSLTLGLALGSLMASIVKDINPNIKESDLRNNMEGAAMKAIHDSKNIHYIVQGIATSLANSGQDAIDINLLIFLLVKKELTDRGFDMKKTDMATELFGKF